MGHFEAEQGKLSINSENIMPIIKKWLYSDTDIFLRELVANATDACKKLKRLRSLGEAAGEWEFVINVSVSKANNTITITDNGIGMTADEVKKYINQIAFSGANDFVEKYKDAQDDIIGHFGLGFYSAFMVADRVEIESLSYREGAEAIHWSSDGTEEYSISPSDKTQVGTKITLHVNEDGHEFLEEYRLRSILRKYCGYMPVPIYLEDADKPAEPELEVSNETEPVDETSDKSAPPVLPVNDSNPLWMRNPADCSDEDYKAFYHKAFTDFNDPLFYIHLNMDYPFRLKGILYFPRLRHEMEYTEGQVKLFNNQVFVADNIKEVIPEFLLLLKGVMDCPDLPLNVSRSFLQNDANVKKMSGYITKKVADKLAELFNEDRETYNKYWDDLSPFVKYGCIRDQSFFEKISDQLLFKTHEGEYLTLEEYFAANGEKVGRTVYYVTNEQLQAQYINMFKAQGVSCVMLGDRIDNPFISYIESYNYGKEDAVTFCRIDGELKDFLKNEDESVETGSGLVELFKSVLGDSVSVEASSLKAKEVPGVILLSEQQRRMEEMTKQFGGGMGLPGTNTEGTLMVNQNSPLIEKLLNISADESRKEDVDLICRHVYDLALLSHKPLDAAQMAEFIDRSSKMMEKLAQ